MQIWEVYTGKRAQKKTDSDLRSKVDAFEESLFPIFVTLVAACWILALLARIQHLLRGHKYRVSALFGSCLLAAHANSGFILRKIWERLQTVVIFWGIEMLEDWHLSYHFKLFDIITIRLWHWFKCQSYRISFPGTSTSPVLFPKSLQLVFWATNKQNSWR